MDLRGLTPEDVYQLMGSGLQDKQLTMMDQYRKDQLEQEAGIATQRDKIARQKLELDSAAEGRLQRGQEAELSRPRDLGTYTANGKTYLRYVDPQTNQIATRDLGDAGDKLQNKKLLKDGEGKGYWVSPGDPIRPGSTYLASQDNGFSINDQYTLSFLKSGVESGLDKDGNEVDEATRDNNMTMVNLNDKSDQFVKIPGKAIEWGKDIPSQYIKIPKQAAKIASLPGSKIIYYDDASGKALTVDAVKQIAKDKGYSIEEFLKVSGIGK